MIGGGYEKGGLYHFGEKPSLPTTFSAVASPLHIHSRSDNPSLDMLKQLIPNLSHVKSLECETYQLGKNHRVSFPSRVNKRVSSHFMLIRTYVWGPSRVTSKLGFRYFVTFVDDYSRSTWIYLMKKRSMSYFLFFAHFVLKLKLNLACLLVFFVVIMIKDIFYLHFVSI